MDEAVDSTALAERMLAGRVPARPDDVALVSAYLESRPDVARRLGAATARTAADGHAADDAARRELLTHAEVQRAVTVAPEATAELYDALAEYLARAQGSAGTALR